MKNTRPFCAQNPIECSGKLTAINLKVNRGGKYLVRFFDQETSSFRKIVEVNLKNGVNKISIPSNAVLFKSEAVVVQFCKKNRTKRPLRRKSNIKSLIR